MIRKSFYKIFICTLIVLAAFFSLYKTSALYAVPGEGEEELSKEVEELIKEEEGLMEKQAAIMKFVCEKMKKRTKECKESIDALFFTLNGLTRQAGESQEREREKEFIAILSDYNSVMGDLGIMQVILDMDELIDDEKFMEYFNYMAIAFERLKDSFSLKNELFLNRIDGLEDEDALRYEKRLLRLYREYFEYDLWREQVEDYEHKSGETEKTLPVSSLLNHMKRG